jgi:hypothetical protein
VLGYEVGVDERELSVYNHTHIPFLPLIFSPIPFHAPCQQSPLTPLTPTTTGSFTNALQAIRDGVFAQAKASIAFPETSYLESHATRLLADHTLTQ